MSPREVDPYAVPCPSCVAGVHEHCVTPAGKEVAKPHAKRRRAAEEAAAARQSRAEGDATQRIEGDDAARWRRLYVACRLELEQRGDLTTLALEELESLVLNMQAAAHYRADAARSPTVKGSTGQKVVNPASAHAARLDAQALATARSLKLTPDTRGTSAFRPGDEDVPADAGDEPAGDGEVDELAGLDEVALKRRARHGKGKGSSARRRGGG